MQTTDQPKLTDGAGHDSSAPGALALGGRHSARFGRRRRRDDADRPIRCQRQRGRDLRVDHGGAERQHGPDHGELDRVHGVLARP